MKTRLAVANAGPLIALAGIGELRVLPGLFERVLVPDAVMREVTEAGLERPGARAVREATFLERRAVDPGPEPLLASELGPGEAAVIALAHRLGAEFALLDERRARRTAERAYGLRVRGSAGLLVAAKRAGLVAAVRPLLEAMIRNGYFVSMGVVERACREAGE